jgi:four-jointed box protein 1
MFLSVRWTVKIRLEHYLYLFGYKKAKGYLLMKFMALFLTMARMCWLIAIGFTVGILLPLAVPLKLLPVNESQSPRPALVKDQQRIEIEGTVNSPQFQIQSIKSSERDFISKFSKNLTLKHDLNKDQEKIFYENNLDSNPGIGEQPLNSASNAIIESEIEFQSLSLSEKDRKFQNKSLSDLSIVPKRHDKTLRNNNSRIGSYVRSISSSSNVANKTNLVPTVDSLYLASGPESISVSHESNGHQEERVVSGIGIHGIRSRSEASFSRNPVESVKQVIESRRAELPSVTAGTPNRKLATKNKLHLASNIISNGIYWSKELETLTPKGFDKIDDIEWSQLINSSIAVKMVEGCGRMQNRLIMFEDGQMSCARHRQNNDQIQGDIFSFYLARVLGISNLPPATIAVIKASSGNRYDARWERVRTQLHLAQWNTKPVVLTKYISDLVPAFIPHLLRSDNRRLHPLAEDIGSLNKTELIELVQWSDLIVFDYLTGNLDRIVNNMINQKWNPEMMQNPAHNLLKVKNSGLLLFIDNESGLLHGYRLLKKYEPQHNSLLSALCVFRQNTAKLIQYLHNNQNLIYLIKSLFQQYVLDSQAYKSLPFLPEHNIQILYQRLGRVNRQINYCKSLYNSN